MFQLGNVFREINDFQIKSASRAEIVAFLQGKNCPFSAEVPSGQELSL